MLNPRELERRLGVVVGELEARVRQLCEEKSSEEGGEGNENERRRLTRKLDLSDHVFLQAGGSACLHQKGSDQGAPATHLAQGCHADPFSGQYQAGRGGGASFPYKIHFSVFGIVATREHVKALPCPRCPPQCSSDSSAGRQKGKLIMITTS